MPAAQLTPYDTGDRAEAKVWIPYGTKITPATPVENFGKVDFDDDEGHTIAVVYIERTAQNTHRIVVDPLGADDELEIVTRSDT